MHSPRIAILMDEDTSRGGRRYEAARGYFTAVRDAGGLPFGIPYLAEIVSPVLREFDGLVTCGGRFAFPTDWYVDLTPAPSPRSERLDVELALVRGMLAADKPVLGICAGMQVLACAQGARMCADVTAAPGVQPHDEAGRRHAVWITSGTQLHAALGAQEVEVNTFHREAVVELGPPLAASARAPDGVIEAVESPDARFAIGVQWHPELMGGETSSARLFHAFVSACRETQPA